MIDTSTSAPTRTEVDVHYQIGPVDDQRVGDVRGTVPVDARPSCDKMTAAGTAAIADSMRARATYPDTLEGDGSDA